MDYKLTAKGRTATSVKPESNAILDWMKDGHGVINPEEISEEVTLPAGVNSKEVLDRLVKAGYLSKDDTESEPGLDVMGPDPYSNL